MKGSLLDSLENSRNGQLTTVTTPGSIKKVGWLWLVVNLIVGVILVIVVVNFVNTNTTLNKAALVRPAIAEGYARLENQDSKFYFDQDGKRYYLNDRDYYGLLETMPQDVQRYVLFAYLPGVQHVVEAQVYDAADKAKLLASFADIPTVTGGYKASLYSRYPSVLIFVALGIGILLVNLLMVWLYRRERRRWGL
jgi:hypothetical protein